LNAAKDPDKGFGSSTQFIDNYQTFAPAFLLFFAVQKYNLHDLANALV
jgi:hypothetical protein